MKNTAIPVVLGILAVLGVVLVALAYTVPGVLHPQTPVACTTEAKICPDGSAVGRTGPNCEFAACPGAASANCTVGNCPFEITAADNGKTFTYTETSRFTVELDSTKYSKAALACSPSGILGSISNEPAVQPPLFAKRFEAVAVGSCVLADKDFSVTITVVGDSSGSSSGPPVVGPGQHCGGNMLNAPVCSTGYHCQLKVNMPDTGGTCVANSSSQGGGGGILPYNSGVQGKVMLGPTCPVMRDPPDPQCADRPYQTTVTIFRSSDTTHPYATTKSAADGSFKFSLPPGQYVLTAQGGQMLPRCNETSVTVGPSGYVTQDISCDTGIR